MTVIITKVAVSDKKKDGTPLIDKNGKPYKKIGIQTNIHGAIWLSCLSFKENDPVRLLQVGQSADIVVEQNGEYYNFSLPTRTDTIESRLEELEKRVSKLEGEELPDIQVEDPEEIDPDSLPF